MLVHCDVQGHLRRLLTKLRYRATYQVTERCLTLDFAGPPPNSPSHEWPTTQVKIAVGRTTLSDLSIELGAPLRIFYREDERMRIHRRTGGGSPGGALSGRFEGEGSVGGLSEDDGGDADEEDGCCTSIAPPLRSSGL